MIHGHQVAITALAIGAGGTIFSASYDGMVLARTAASQPVPIAGKVSEEPSMPLPDTTDAHARSFVGCMQGHGKKVSGIAASLAGGPVLTVGWDDKLRVADQSSMEYNAEAVRLTVCDCVRLSSWSRSSCSVRVRACRE